MLQLKWGQFGLLVSVVSFGSVQAAPPRVAPVPDPIPTVTSTANLDTEQRLTRIERMLDNKVMFDLLTQLEQLRVEVSELREIVEQQDHQMSVLTQRQRNLYQDIDRRILDLETGSRKTTSSKRSGLSSIPRPGNSSITPPATTSLPSTSSKTDTSATPAEDERTAYSKAFNLLKEGRYGRAIVAFREFLQNYGSGKYADNAQYWLGEANYVARDYKTALKEFQRIINDFPDSPKRPDAELKIGFTFYELKDWAASRQALQQVIEHYPNTTVARLSEQRLDRLTREGH